MISVADFKAQFPEFAKAPDDVVTVRLQWAYDRTPLDIWGDARDQGAAWYCAHFLAILPNGKDMRKGERPGETMYLTERKRMALTVSSGFRVTGRT